ncbi:MAG: transposase [Janthinobacterium lividum]
MKTFFATLCLVLLAVRWSANSGQNRVLSFERHERQPPPTKRRRYDAAFRAEALRLASESRSTQGAARALNIDPKRIYKWQKESLTPVAAACGPLLD